MVGDVAGLLVPGLDLSFWLALQECQKSSWLVFFAPLQHQSRCHSCLLFPSSSSLLPVVSVNSD